MKILVISDTHGNLEHARRIIRHEKPDRVLHLGDMITDAQQLQKEFPALRIAYIPGNCDGVTGADCIGIMEIDGCRIYYTHGHEHKVKLSLMRLRLAAQEAQTQVAAFGHTHVAYCERVDGLWLLNPGSCQRRDDYALIELKDGVPYCELRSLEGDKNAAYN